MALTTPVSFRQIGATTQELNGKTGVDKQIVVDTQAHTLAVMDGTTPGGHRLAKEAVKIKAGSANVHVNGGTEATLASDITVSVDAGEAGESYVAGSGIGIADGSISVSLGAGLKFDADGKITLDLDPNGLLEITEGGKLALKSIVSSDNDNILAEGSDGGVYLPGDLGDL